MPPVPDASMYILYSGCDQGLCRTLAGSGIWQLVAGASLIFCCGLGLSLLPSESTAD